MITTKAYCFVDTVEKRQHRRGESFSTPWQLLKKGIGSEPKRISPKQRIAVRCLSPFSAGCQQLRLACCPLDILLNAVLAEGCRTDVGGGRPCVVAGCRDIRVKAGSAEITGTPGSDRDRTGLVANAMDHRRADGSSQPAGRGRCAPVRAASLSDHCIRPSSYRYSTRCGLGVFDGRWISTVSVGHGCSRRVAGITTTIYCAIRVRTRRHDAPVAGPISPATGIGVCVWRRFGGLGTSRPHVTRGGPAESLFPRTLLFQRNEASIADPIRRGRQLASDRRAHRAFRTFHMHGLTLHRDAVVGARRERWSLFSGTSSRRGLFFGLFPTRAPL